LEQAKTQHAEQKLYMEEVIADIENVDIAEATARITADQVQLEASFAVTARLSQLNLIDFLR
ncbi:MAG: flagellar biosynthesis protein FlgL, partial [Gammaproteobacteria bacterium]|nr:flagellar biosynthesis protein FlgL [Gammaproteobacteria bacterium]